MKALPATVIAVTALAAGRGLVAAPAAAQVVTEMTPERIREAIADAESPGCYELKDLGCFTTPYSRVVQAARAARKEYSSFGESDVTPEMLEPHVEIIALPQPSFVFGSGRTGPPIDVQAVVVMPRKSKDRTAAILPSDRADLDRTYKNLLGASFDARAVVAAVFPLSVLSEKNEVRFVYDGKGCADWKHKLQSECGVRFKLDSVK